MNSTSRGHVPQAGNPQDPCWHCLSSHPSAPSITLPYRLQFSSLHRVYRHLPGATVIITQSALVQLLHSPTPLSAAGGICTVIHGASLLKAINSSPSGSASRPKHFAWPVRPLSPSASLAYRSQLHITSSGWPRQSPFLFSQTSARPGPPAVCSDHAEHRFTFARA